MNPPRKRTRLITLIAIGGLVFVALVVSDAQKRSGSLPVPKVPTPNGYDDFLKAGRLCVAGSADMRTLDTWSREELRQAVAQNAEPLQVLRAGLNRPAVVPVNWSDGNAYMTTQPNNFPLLKTASRTMHVEARWMEAEGRTNDAARVYLEIIQFGQQSSRGGVVIDWLVGMASEIVGMKGLQRIAPALDAKTCRESAQTLEKWEANRQPISETIRLEDLFIRKAHGWQGKLIRIVQFRSYKKAQQNWMQKAAAHELQMQALITDLARRAYELENGRPPERLDQLVPNYLTKVPLARPSATAPPK